MADSHEQWLAQIDAELDGELSLVERAALAKSADAVREPMKAVKL